MVDYDRIGLFEGMDFHKTNDSHKCVICHYWYFLEIIFRFQPKVCYGCHDSIQKAKSFNDVAVISLKGNDLIMSFLYMSKDEVMNLLRSGDLNEKVGRF